MLRGRLSVIRIVVLFPYKFALLQLSQFLERVNYHSVLLVVRGTLTELMCYRTNCIHQRKRIGSVTTVWLNDLVGSLVGRKAKCLRSRDVAEL